VLSDHFEQVPIIERDRLPEQVEVRKGVPQGQHVHALLAKGAVILAELFPGLFEALTRQGAIRFTPQDIRSYTMGTWNTRFPSTIHIYSQSRHFEQREPMSNQMKSTTDLHIRLQLAVSSSIPSMRIQLAEPCSSSTVFLARAASRSPGHVKTGD
jgi:hypothetical protein